MTTTDKLNKHYGRKTDSLPQWVQFELEDKIRIEQLSTERYQRMEELKQACVLLVDALEPMKHNPNVMFSGFPAEALRQGKGAISRADGGI